MMKKLVSFALVLVMLFAIASVSVGAEFTSPGGKTYYSVTTSSEGQGDAHSDKNKVDINPSTTEDGYVTLTAEEGGGSFVKWVIEGDYNVISGDENSLEFVIEPLSDIKAVAVFEGGETVPVVTPTEKPNTDNTSPKTGDPTMMFVVLALAALGLGVFAVKKIKE